MEPIQLAMIIVLIISVVIHEMAHGYAANWLGDPTARLAGRLSPNPLVHLDPMMSVILPGLLIMSGSPILFGAAKPVPYNRYNFNRHQRWGEAIVAIAGPASNIAIALIFALLVRGVHAFDALPAFLDADMFFGLMMMVVMLNIFLAFFNLVPIPPLDGSKILPRLLPRALSMQYERFRAVLEQNIALGFLIVIGVFYFILAGPLFRLTVFLTEALTGVQMG